MDGRRLIVYTDAKGYGGHDILTVRAIRCLLERGAELAIYYRESTELWARELDKLAAEYRFELHPLTLPRIRFHAPYHFFHPGLTQSLATRFQAFKPDAVFTSQGNLEISAIGSLAARKAGIPCLGYIPLTHSFRELKANRSFRRDLFNSYLARVPDRWLTITESMRKRLRLRGANQPIDLIPNVIEVPTPPSQQEARRSLGIPEDARVLGMAGRLEDKQKGTNILLQTLLTLPDAHPWRDSWVLLIGDGLSRETMVRELEAAGWAGRLVWQPWCDDPWRYYSAYDLMIAPSYFEGLPIAVQEAVLCGVPVAATNVDGLGDFLPADWTCPPGDAKALLGVMEHYRANPQGYRLPLESLQHRIHTEQNAAAFERGLLDSFSRLWGENDIAQTPMTVKV